jgi:hypothetical protein
MMRVVPVPAPKAVSTTKILDIDAIETSIAFCVLMKLLI